jgi:formylglycine-generating enzyme required for sulfatase activity
VTGRGSVSYEYRIGRTEITAGQWAEFLRAALLRSDPIPWVTQPTVWPGFNPPPERQMNGVGGITWREAAIYANWLHNDKSLDRAAFMSGAYDVSTFGATPDGVITDQAEHSAGARFWVPTHAEWLKASFYDPHKANPDGTLGGWWRYSITSDTPPVYGPPVGFPGGSPLNQANSGFTLGGQEYQIPLGAYSEVAQSPWGLLDTAGATSEWLEDVYTDSLGFRLRLEKGSAWHSSTGGGVLDSAWDIGAVDASNDLEWRGFRIAAAVPGPGDLTVTLILGTMLLRRSRR